MKKKRLILRLIFYFVASNKTHGVNSFKMLNDMAIYYRVATFTPLVSYPLCKSSFFFLFFFNVSFSMSKKIVKKMANNFHFRNLATHAWEF